MIRARVILPVLAGVMLAASMLVAPPVSASRATQADWRGRCPTTTPAEDASDGIEGVLDGGEVQWFRWELPQGQSYNTLDLVADGDTGLRVCVAGMEARNDLCRSGDNPGRMPEGCADPVFGNSTNAWVVATTIPNFGRAIYGPARNVRIGVFRCTTGAPVPNSKCPGSPADGPISYKLSVSAVFVG